MLEPALKNRRKSPERGWPPSPCHPEEVTETVLLANSRLMDSLPMIDLLGTFSPSGQPGCEDSGVKVFASLLQVTVPPFGVMVMKPDVAPPGGYTN